MKKHNPYKVLIISCWAMLLICFIIQLLGADLFKAGTNNETFIKLCDFIDNNLWLERIIICLNCILLGSLTVLAMLKQKFYTKIQLFIFIPCFICLSIVGWYSSIANTILSFIIYFLPSIWLKKKWYRCAIGIGLIYLFQFASMFVKNIGGFYLNDIPFLTSWILQLDSIIMVLLYYLYSTRKEKQNG